MTITIVFAMIEKGLTGRKLLLGDWDNPTKTYRLGIKRAYEFFPKDLVKQMKKERKQKFDQMQRELIDQLQRQISEYDKSTIKPQIDKKGSLSSPLSACVSLSISILFFISFFYLFIHFYLICLIVNIFSLFCG
jgi:hypothetical protein